MCSPKQPEKKEKEADPLTSAWSNTRCPVCLEDLTLVCEDWVYLPCCSSGVCETCWHASALRTCPYCRHDLRETLGNVAASLRMVEKNAERGCPMALFKAAYVMVQELAVRQFSDEELAKLGLKTAQVTWVRETLLKSGPVLTAGGKDDARKRLVAFMRRAADAGHATACLFCGNVDAIPLFKAVLSGAHCSIPQDKQFAYLKRAADSGLPAAKLALGASIVEQFENHGAQNLRLPGASLHLLDDAIAHLKPLSDSAAPAKLATACLIHPKLVDTVAGVREWARLLALASAAGSVEAHVALARVCRDTPFPQLDVLRNDRWARTYLARLRRDQPSALTDADARFLQQDASSGEEDSLPRLPAEDFLVRHPVIPSSSSLSSSSSSSSHPCSSSSERREKKKLPSAERRDDEPS